MRGPRTDSDDRTRPFRHHDRQGGTHPVIDPLEVYIDRRTPGVGVGVHQWADRIDDTGVADHHVQRAEGLDRGVGGARHFRPAGDIAGDRQRGLADFACKVGDGPGAARQKGDVGTLGGESTRGGGPDATRCAGYQNGLRGKVRHGFPLLTPPSGSDLVSETLIEEP